MIKVFHLGGVGGNPPLRLPFSAAWKGKTPSAGTVDRLRRLAFPADQKERTTDSALFSQTGNFYCP